MSPKALVSDIENEIKDIENEIKDMTQRFDEATEGQKKYLEKLEGFQSQAELLAQQDAIHGSRVVSSAFEWSKPSALVSRIEEEIVLMRKRHEEATQQYENYRDHLWNNHRQAEGRLAQQHASNGSLMAPSVSPTNTGFESTSMTSEDSTALQPSVTPETSNPATVETLLLLPVRLRE